DSVETLGEQAFRGCHKLKNIRLSNSIKKLDYGLFEGCKSLYNISIPKACVEIDKSVFRYCKNLKYITLPDGRSMDVYKEILSALKSQKNVSTIYLNKNKSKSLVKYLQSKSWDVKELDLQKKQITLKKGESFELRMNSHAKCNWKSSNS